MKAEGSKPTRYLQNGHVVYSSGTLHFQPNQMRGFLYKQGEPKFFQARLYYKRYFVINAKQNFIQV